MGLEGKTVVVTRAEDQARDLIDALMNEGAKVLVTPMLIIEPVAFDLPDLVEFDLVLLSSRNAGEQLVRRAGTLQGARGFACVGEKTAGWVKKRYSGPVVAPANYRGEALADAVVEHFQGNVRGRRFFLPQADAARGMVAERLRASGAEVLEVTVYRSLPGPPRKEALGDVDIVTFLSGQTLVNFLASVPKAELTLANSVVAVIGPVTQRQAEDLGIRVDVVPDEATIESLVTALRSL